MLEMPNLPEEVIFDILSRLPVVSICRFRCVSKPWRFLFSSPLFTRAHLNRSTNNKKDEHLALSCGPFGEIKTLYSLHFEWSPSGGEVPVKPRTLLDLDCEEICGSCDGMLLTRICMEDGGIHYSLVNPSTGESRRFSQSPFVLDPRTYFNDYYGSGYDSRKNFNDYGFGYDSNSDDYKVVSISHDLKAADNVVSMYSLRTDSWKKIEKYPYNHSDPYNHSGTGRITGTGRKSGVLVNGALHWFTGTSTGAVIVALDLADEKFRILPYTLSMDVELTVLGGYLCVYGNWVNDDDRVDFWVMKEYGVNDSWTKFTVTVHSNWWKPLSLSRTGQVLLQGNYHCLLLFDQQEGNSRRLDVHGLPDVFGVETYVESLVSPNRQC